MYHGGSKLAFVFQRRTLATSARATVKTTPTCSWSTAWKESRSSWTVRASTAFPFFLHRPIPQILPEHDFRSRSRRHRSIIPTTCTGTVESTLVSRTKMSSSSRGEQVTNKNATNPLTRNEDDSKDTDSAMVKQRQRRRRFVEVDVIVPVHNAAATIVSTVESAMTQIIPDDLELFAEATNDNDHQQDLVHISIHVCCYDDGSTDDSWKLLTQLQQQQQQQQQRLVANEASTAATPIPTTTTTAGRRRIPTTLHISKSADGVARGAGYARNRAVEMRNNHQVDDLSSDQHQHQQAAVPTEVDRFLCMLDSDDMMHPARVAHQVAHLFLLPPAPRERTLLGCTFDRDPPDATWHYAQWANGLSDASLVHEQYRELTLLQPTWMLTRSRFLTLQGYMEAPHPNDTRTLQEYLVEKKYNGDKNNDNSDNQDQDNVLHLVHADFETLATLRVAEDLRFFHAHMAAQGLLRLHRTAEPLLTYKHCSKNLSQSSQTPRRLLLYLRARAFERRVLQTDPIWQRHDGAFCVWGAGRDGKDFVKALSPEMRRRVYCMVDVDDKKIEGGYYVNQYIDVKIPIVHFSLLAVDPDVRQRLQHALEQGIEPGFGKIDKSKPSKVLPETVPPPRKKRRVHAVAPGVLDLAMLPVLPVVVCVAMYRTNGALEQNVKTIGRTEGKDLWHFS